MCLRKDNGWNEHDRGFEGAVCLRSSRTPLFFDVYKLVFSVSILYQRPENDERITTTTTTTKIQTYNDSVIRTSKRSNSSILSFACCDWMIMRTGTICWVNNRYNGGFYIAKMFANAMEELITLCLFTQHEARIGCGWQWWNATRFATWNWHYHFSCAEKQTAKQMKMEQLTCKDTMPSNPFYLAVQK